MLKKKGSLAGSLFTLVPAGFIIQIRIPTSGVHSEEHRFVYPRREFHPRGPHGFQGPNNTRAEYVTLGSFRLIRYPRLDASMAIELSVPYPYPIQGKGLRSSGCSRRVCVYGLCISVRERHLPITKIGPYCLAYSWLNATALVPPDLLSPSNHRKKWGFTPRKGSIPLDLALVSEVEIPHLNPRVDSGPWITESFFCFHRLLGGSCLVTASWSHKTPKWAHFLVTRRVWLS